MRNPAAGNFLLAGLSELSGIAHTPDGAVPVFADEKAAVFGHGDFH
jgi:hypothetical protein